MHLTSTLSSIAILALSLANGLAIEERATTTCNTANVNLVKSRIVHDVYFCAFYTSYPRSRSPFLQLGAADTVAACKCIEAEATTTSTQVGTATPTSTACSASDINIVKNEYFNPTAFCSFYTAQPRTRSTIPGVSIASLQKACRCLSAASSSTTTKKASTTIKAVSTIKKTTTTTTKAKATTLATAAKKATPSPSSATCSHSPLSPSVGDFAHGLQNWDTTVSANALLTTGTSYDSDGSAAMLTCTYARSANARASLHTQILPLCIGKAYTVSFKYKFAPAYLDGTLTLYDYGRDALLATIAGPTTPSAADSNGVAIGTWGSYSATFTSLTSADMVLITLGCSAGGQAAGQSARVTVDNVRVTLIS